MDDKKMMMIEKITYGSGAEAEGGSVVLHRVLLIVGYVACLSESKGLVAFRKHLGWLCCKKGGVKPSHRARTRRSDSPILARFAFGVDDFVAMLYGGSVGSSPAGCFSAITSERTKAAEKMARSSSFSPKRKIDHNASIGLWQHK